MNAHTNKITGCDVSPDRKLFATVSLDLNLKVKPRKKKQFNSELHCFEVFIIYVAVLRCGQRRRAQKWPLSWIPPPWTVWTLTLRVSSWQWDAGMELFVCGTGLNRKTLRWGMTQKIHYYALYTKTYNLSSIQTLLGHQSSVRSLSFSPCSSMLCSGCLSGEVRLWSVTGAACVGSYHAHRGSTQSLNFLQGGNLLLSAGHDSVVRNMIW